MSRDSELELLQEEGDCKMLALVKDVGSSLACPFLFVPSLGPLKTCATKSTNLRRHLLNISEDLGIFKSSVSGDDND